MINIILSSTDTPAHELVERSVNQKLQDRNLVLHARYQDFPNLLVSLSLKLRKTTLNSKLTLSGVETYTERSRNLH